MTDRLTPIKAFLEEGNEGSGSCQWWVLPTVSRPRILVPTDPVHWSAALRFISSPLRRRILRNLLRVFKCFRKKPDLVHYGDLPSKLVGNCSQAVHFAGYFATPSRFSKYALAVLSSSGTPLAFAKLAEGRDAESAISAEANALERMSETFPGSPSLPRLLYREAGFSLQTSAPEAVPGSLAKRAGRFARKLFDSEAVPVNWEASRVRRKLQDAEDDVRQAGRDDLADAIDEISHGLAVGFGERDFKEGLTHGDFLPWNMVNSKEGFIFDWEWLGVRSEFYDQLHFVWFEKLQRSQASTLSMLVKIWQEEKSQRILGDGGRSVPTLGHAALYFGLAFAFYVRHCVRNGNDPLAFPFVIHLQRAFRQTISFPLERPCHSDSLN